MSDVADKRIQATAAATVLRNVLKHGICIESVSDRMRGQEPSPIPRADTIRRALLAALEVLDTSVTVTTIDGMKGGDMRMRNRQMTMLELARIIEDTDPDHVSVKVVRY